jgi:hypothetical protein
MIQDGSPRSCPRKRAIQKFFISKIPDRASPTLRLIRLWRNRQLSRNDARIIRQISETAHPAPNNKLTAIRPLGPQVHLSCTAVPGGKRLKAGYVVLADTN